MEHVFTLYIADESQKELQNLCQDAGLSLETGLNVILHQLLKQPDSIKQLLAPYRERQAGRLEMPEISIEELTRELSGGEPADGCTRPRLIKNPSGAPYVLLPAGEYRHMAGRLENIQDKLIIRKK